MRTGEHKKDSRLIAVGTWPTKHSRQEAWTKETMGHKKQVIKPASLIQHLFAMLFF